MLILILAAAALIAIGLLALAFRSLKRKRLITDVPTSKTQGVFIGLTELKGTAESDAPLTTYLPGSRCVHYGYTIDEQWSRIVTESYTDAQGNRKTRNRTETGWKTIAQDIQSIPFYLKDDSGILRIVPEGARINGIVSLEQTCHPGDPLYFGKGPAGQIPDSTHKRRFHEVTLPLHTGLYIIGHARERQDVAAAEIARDKDEEMFLISTRSESKITSGYSFGYWGWIIAGLVVAVSGGVAWSLTSNTSMALASSLGITIGVYLVMLLLGWFWSVYNSLINLHHMVEQGWSQVDIQLKRRYDLIPNLVSAVKGYSVHENDVQTLAAELRAQSEATPPGVKGADFKGIAPALRILAEKYPDLKAGASFLSLQKALTDTESRIALARDYFNNAATAYNTRLAIIPDRFVAAAARLKPRTLMTAADFERAPIVVKLAD
jgi:hypothetical protein